MRVSVALLAGLGAAIAIASPAWSQALVSQVATGNLVPRKAVSFGFYYGIGVLNIEAPPSNASNEVKGYTDALPSTIAGTGLSIAISYGKWGIVVGGNDNTGTLNKSADIHQTPTDPTDDVFIKSVHRLNTSLTLVFQPVRYLIFGLGQNQGSIAFDQINPDGSMSTRRIGYSNDFYSLGLAFGFDPESPKFGPILAIFTERPFAPGFANGTINAVAVGLWF